MQLRDHSKNIRMKYRPKYNWPRAITKDLGTILTTCNYQKKIGYETLLHIHTHAFMGISAFSVSQALHVITYTIIVYTPIT